MTKIQVRRPNSQADVTSFPPIKGFILDSQLGLGTRDYLNQEINAGSSDVWNSQTPKSLPVCRDAAKQFVQMKHFWTEAYGPDHQ